MPVEESTEMTQYGLKYPDGTIDWATNEGDVQLVNEVGQQFSLTSLSDDLPQFLAERAKGARMDPAAYVAMHSIVTRVFVTTVTAPSVQGQLALAEEVAEWQ